MSTRNLIDPVARREKDKRRALNRQRALSNRLQRAIPFERMVGDWVYGNLKSIMKPDIRAICAKYDARNEADEKFSRLQQVSSMVLQDLVQGKATDEQVAAVFDELNAADAARKVTHAAFPGRH